MTYQSTDPAGAKTLLAAPTPHAYLDVRSVQEFMQGHVPGAYNVPLLFMTPQGMRPNPDFAAVVQRHFSPGDPLVLGCKAGHRSMHACELLDGLGFTGLVNMEGGFHGAYDGFGRMLQKGWATLGFETTTQPLQGRSWAELSGSSAEKG